MHAHTCMLCCIQHPQHRGAFIAQGSSACIARAAQRGVHKHYKDIQSTTVWRHRHLDKMQLTFAHPGPLHPHARTQHQALTWKGPAEFLPANDAQTPQQPLSDLEHHVLQDLRTLEALLDSCQSRALGQQGSADAQPLHHWGGHHQSNCHKWSPQNMRAAGAKAALTLWRHMRARRRSQPNSGQPAGGCGRYQPPPPGMQLGGGHPQVSRRTLQHSVPVVAAAAVLHGRRCHHARVPGLSAQAHHWPSGC